MLRVWQLQIIMRGCYHPREYLWMPQSTWMECIGRLNRGIQLESIWDFMTNASMTMMPDPSPDWKWVMVQGTILRSIKWWSISWCDQMSIQIKMAIWNAISLKIWEHVSGVLLSTENCLAIGKAWFRRSFGDWIPPTMDIGLMVVSRSFVNRWWWCEAWSEYNVGICTPSWMMKHIHKRNKGVASPRV